MRRVVRRLGRALGHRGFTLTSLGTVWVLYGYSIVTAPLPDTSGVRILLHLAPLSVWGWLWMCAGAAALVAAWLPQGQDAFGFVALLVIVLPWMLSFLLSWKPLGDNPRGWIGAVVWGAMTALVWVTLRWPEPARPKEFPYGS